VTTRVTFNLGTLMTTFLARTSMALPSRLAEHPASGTALLRRKQVNFMSTVTIVAIIVAVIVVGALVIGVMAVLRRRRLQQRFGPEYDRLVGERDSKLKAEAELAERERRVRGLDIRPLTDLARASYADQWAGIQEQFVDTPADAVAASQVLVVAVMSERGYPAEHRDQVLADLSVDHARAVDRYRAAEEISESAASGTASTEDLRLAMIHYRALFRDLLGEPADAMSGSAATEPVEVIAAEDTTPKTGDAQVAETQRAMPADDPVADGASQQHNGSDAEELTK
jgi:hypothetical protein